jgi:hypothetical protein
MIRPSHQSLLFTVLICITCLQPAGAQSPLAKAIARGDSVLLDSLLRNGVAADSLDERGMAPLHWAAMGQSTGVIAALLGRGADINRLSGENRTPLYYARGRVACFLREHGGVGGRPREPLVGFDPIRVSNDTLLLGKQRLLVGKATSRDITALLGVPALFVTDRQSGRSRLEYDLDQGRVLRLEFAPRAGARGQDPALIMRAANVHADC